MAIEDRTIPKTDYYEALYLEYERETDMRRKHDIGMQMLKCLRDRIERSSYDTHETDGDVPTVYKPDVIWDVQNKMRYDWIQNQLRDLRSMIQRGYV
jgi:hypothetical protein